MENFYQFFSKLLAEKVKDLNYFDILGIEDLLGIRNILLQSYFLFFSFYLIFNLLNNMRLIAEDDLD